MAVDTLARAAYSERCFPTGKQTANPKGLTERTGDLKPDRDLEEEAAS